MQMEIECLFPKHIQEGQFSVRGGCFTKSRLKSVKAILNGACSDQLLISSYRYGKHL